MCVKIIFSDKENLTMKCFRARGEINFSQGSEDLFSSFIFNLFFFLHFRLLSFISPRCCLEASENEEGKKKRIAFPLSTSDLSINTALKELESGRIQVISGYFLLSILLSKI